MRDLPELKCPKCGEKMEYLYDTEWSLWSHYEIDAICPNCLHVQHCEYEESEDDDE